MPGRLRRPPSGSGKYRNCRQETGGKSLHPRVNIGGMNSGFVARLGPANVSLRKLLLPLFVLFLSLIGGSACANAAVVATPRITLIVFTDKHMPEGEWQALSRDLQQEYSLLAAETHFYPGAFNLVRGDTLVPGLEIESPITIYLHGECTLVGRPGQSIPQGALGWVLRSHGRIEPFIHVDCGRIGDMLGNYAQAMNHDLRDNVMAEAIARIVVHEWIHLATQSPAHAQDGISRSTFRVADLIPNFWPQVAGTSRGR